MFFPFTLFHHFQQRLIVFVHQYDTAEAGLLKSPDQEVLEADGQRCFRIFAAIDFFPFLQMDIQNTLQCFLFFIIIPVKIKVKHRIRFPGFRISFFQFFNLQSPEEFLFPLPVRLHGRQQEAFSEPSGSAEKILRPCLNKVIDISCFVNIKKISSNQFFKTLDSDR